MIIRLLLTLITFTIFLFSCKNDNNISIETGDLLFRGKNQSSLSNAIDAVTQTHAKNHFSHVGLVEIIDGEIFVIHADYSSGVSRDSLTNFISNKNGENLYVEIYRLKENKRDLINAAINRASKLIGEPYNYSYIIEDSGYYCSELIWYAFAPDSVFTLEPMTFKDPTTGNYHEGWKNHYKKLGIEIPEGLPGCNPNGMATSEKIKFIGTIKPN